MFPECQYQNVIPVCLEILKFSFKKHCCTEGWPFFVIVKGWLHTTIFSKYRELLQSKNIFRTFQNYF